MVHSKSCSFNGYVQILISDLKTRKSAQVLTTWRNFKEKKNQTMNDLDGLDEMCVKKLDKLEMVKITPINEGGKSEKKYVGILIVMG